MQSFYVIRLKYRIYDLTYAAIIYFWKKIKYARLYNLISYFSGRYLFIPEVDQEKPGVYNWEWD
jgi:hypothetical protein